MNFVALTRKIPLKDCRSRDESVGNVSGSVARFKEDNARRAGNEQSACYFLSLVSVRHLQQHPQRS